MKQKSVSGFGTKPSFVLYFVINLMQIFILVDKKDGHAQGPVHPHL